MFVNEDQANHWIKLVQWKYSRRDLKKKKKNSFWQNARTLARDRHQEITVGFPKPVDWLKI